MVFVIFCHTVRASQVDQEFSFRDIPKAELHLHLGGSYPLSFLLEIADSQQKAHLLDSFDLIAKGISYQNVFQVFSIVSQIVNTDSKVEAGTYALCEDLKADGVVYAEIRTGLKNLGNGLESYLQSVLNGMEKAKSAQFKSCLLLSLQRNSPPEFAKRTIDLALQYQDKGVVGIDISGDSTIGDIEAILPELVRAREEGLFLTLHIGESPLEKNQRALLETLNPHRIGHGVHLSSEASEWILENKIPFEVCLSSSVFVQMVDHHVNHPALHYRLQGHPIVICTDDPLLFQTTLSKELQLLFDLSIFNREEIIEIAKDGFRYAFSRGK